MQIVLRRSRAKPTLMLIFLLLPFLAAAAYAIYFWRDYRIGLGVAAVGGFIVFMMNEIIPEGAPTLLIDDTGIYDERLGMGKIEWADVREVHIEYAYGNRYLCLSLANPDAYISRLSGPKRDKVIYHRNLGFYRFNVDVKNVDLSLLDLKKQVESLIARYQKPADGRP